MKGRVICVAVMNNGDKKNLKLLFWSHLWQLKKADEGL